MPTPGWPRLARLFDELVTLDPGSRERRLEALRGEDAELAAHLAGLLAVDALPGGLLDRGLASVLAGTGERDDREEDLCGQLAGAYRLTESIGGGGMGTVYAAERADGLYHHRVAVKVLASAGSPELLRRFDRERAILAALEHPHIARLLDAGSLGSPTEGERPYLVMELVEGVDLATHCDRLRADLATRLQLFLDVCAAVGHAHRLLVVHRDLKPSNVMVSADGEVKLLDFGVAALFDREGPAQATTTLARRAFTPAYAAPEQVLGEPVSTATDVYALGALLHELLVGRPPRPALSSHQSAASPLTATLAALSPAEASEAAAHRALAGARQLARELRGDLAAIVAVALRPQPAERYRSVQELADDVERHLAGQPVAARGDDRAYRARRFVRRHRLGLAASALALTGLVAGLLVAVVQAREARSEARRARALRQFLLNELKREPVASQDPGGPRLGSLFARGLPDVDREFADQPEVAAEIFSIAAKTFFMIGDHPRAIAAFRGAMERWRALYGESDPRVASARGDIAHVLLERGDLTAAQPLFEELSAPDSPLPAEERSDMLSYLGRLHVLRGNLAAAERARRQLLAAAVDLRDQGKALERLAAVLYLRGRVRESERLLGESLALRPPWTALATSHWRRRADALHRMGALGAARQAYSHAETANATSADPWTSATGCGQELLLIEEGDATAARALLAGKDLPLADLESQGGLEYREAGVPCVSLHAWLAGDLPALQRSFTRPTPPTSPISALDRADRDLLLAELLLSHGRAAEALPLCDAVVRTRDANADLLPWRRAEAHLLRGLVLSRLGRLGEGRPEIARSAPVLATALPRHRFLRLVAAGGSPS